MMAQKINSNKIRLKKRLNWNNVACAHNFNDYFNLVNNTSTIMNTNRIIAYCFKTNHNFSNIFKSSKNYKLIFECLDERFFFYCVNLINSQKNYETIDTNYFQYKFKHLAFIISIMKTFLLSQTQLKIHSSNLQLQKKLWKNNDKTSSSFLLYPWLVNQFIKTNLSEIGNVVLKTNTFSRNIQGNIINFIALLLFEFKYDILGLKIICSGRWKKTNTGRKQKLYLKLGQIQSSNVTNKIIYNNINQTTKYGVCSVKIWIAHKIK